MRDYPGSLTRRFGRLWPAICTCTNVLKRLPFLCALALSQLGRPHQTAAAAPPSARLAHWLPATHHRPLPTTTSTTNIPANISAPLHILVAPTPHQPPTSEQRTPLLPKYFFKILVPSPTLDSGP